MTRRRQRRGFALLAVLWVTVGLSAIALAGLLAARGAAATARNRIALTRGRWRAEDCVERARAVIDDALSGGNAIPRPIAGGWDALDRVVAASPAVTAAQCDVTMTPAGVAVDVNVADAEQVRATLLAAGVVAPQADSMTDALLDWRDPDDIPRPLGAERDWYAARGLFTPRNGRIADIRELRRIRGFNATVLPDSTLAALFTVEPGRILWSRAPLAVLAGLPGVDDEAHGLLREARLSLPDLRASLSPAAQKRMDAHYADLQRLTTDHPDAWLLTARDNGATIEVRLALAGPRAAIVRRRTTP